MSFHAPGCQGVGQAPLSRLFSQSWEVSTAAHPALRTRGEGSDRLIKLLRTTQLLSGGACF